MGCRMITTHVHTGRKQPRGGARPHQAWRPGACIYLLMVENDRKRHFLGTVKLRQHQKTRRNHKDFLKTEGR